MSPERGTSILINVHRKDVVRLTLRVYPGGEVRITAPLSASDDEIRAFIVKHLAWLKRSLEQCKNSDPEGTIRWLGQMLELCQQLSSTKRVEKRGDKLIISGPSDIACRKALDTWWREQLLEICSAYIAKWYPVMADKGCRMPEINVRKMSARWGSCTPMAARIRFNYYLLCAPPAEIEYVVLHELAHLAYPDHGTRFKTFMTQHMPDWRERRSTLNSCTCYIGSF